MDPQAQYLAQLQQNAQQVGAPPQLQQQQVPIDPALQALIGGNPGAGQFVPQPAPQQFAPQPQVQQYQQQQQQQQQVQPQYQQPQVQQYQQPQPQVQQPPQQFAPQPLGVDPSLQANLQQAQQTAAAAPDAPAPKRGRGKAKNATAELPGSGAIAELSTADDSGIARATVIAACVRQGYNIDTTQQFLALLGG